MLHTRILQGCKVERTGPQPRQVGKVNFAYLSEAAQIDEPVYEVLQSGTRERERLEVRGLDRS